MLTKALVTNIPQEGSNVYQVRIPLFEDTTSTDIIYDALLCYPPGIYGGLNIGDCVYVAFEDTKLNVPVILGKLYTNIQDDYAYAVINNLDVTQIAKLPDNTKFGDKISVDQMYNMMQNLWSQSLNSEGGCDCDYPIWRGQGAYSTILSSSEGNVASGIYSLVAGYHSDAIGNYSTAIGYNAQATGEGAHAEGSGTLASNSQAHAEGNNTIASGNQAHAEGFYTVASGLYSHSQGRETTASGNYSHAEGFNTTASGAYSHAEGRNTIASRNISHVQGTYNVEDTDGLYADIVGWGTETTRKNISSLTTGGDLHLAKEIYVMSDDDGKNGYKVPYIIEQGTTDGWTYRKWEDGLYECWKSVTFQPTGYTEWPSGSNLYYYTPAPPAETYPITFVELPNVTMTETTTVNNSNSIYFIGSSIPGTTTQTPAPRIMGASTNLTNVHSINFNVRGRWK